MAETKLGKLVSKRGEYFLEVEGKRISLPFTLPTDEKSLQQLVNQDVEVFFSEPAIAAFRPVKRDVQKLFKHPIVTCYVPADVFKIAKTLGAADLVIWTRDAVAKGALTQEQAKRILQRPAK